MEVALEHFIRNCFGAMDALFFSTPASQRNNPTFQHRLCIRISTSQKDKTLSITDLGTGMTRSDLINTLGVGSRLSSNAIRATRTITTTDTQNHRDDSDDDDDSENDSDELGDSSSSSSDGDDNDDPDENMDTTAAKDSQKGTALHDAAKDRNDGDDDAAMDDSNDGRVEDMNGKTREEVVLPCKAGDIGSFYAALCALGVGVEIGTKAKFDDYYEFKLHKNQNSTPTPTTSATNTNPNGSSKKQTSTPSNYTHFTLTRPMKEGIKPTSINGYNKFTDVRGESGTRVTLTLSEAAISAGFLEEERVLRPLLTKILETSQYNVALADCCSEKERDELIDASRKEVEEVEADKLGRNGGDGMEIDEEVDEYMSEEMNSDAKMAAGSHNTTKERSKYIPLRLSMGERKMLRLVIAAMACCDYTTDVDKPFKNAARRTHAQLKGVSSVLRGMVTACDYTAGQKILEDDGDGYGEYQTCFRQLFEIARRHKIMNPEKMRTEYGKLIYLLQDAVSPSVQPHLSFSCKGSVETVYKFLEEHNGLSLLDDPLIDVATREILAGKKTRSQIATEIKRKEKAVEKLKYNHRSMELKSEDIHQCLYSISDNDSFLNSNRVPIDKIIDYLQHFFSPVKIEEGYSLSIISGQDGARLSHSHERQYYFALQSLTLWRDIIDDMFRLWAMAEEDLLSESVTYALKDTGQGMQRVQQSPRTYKSMQQILIRVQGKVKQWIGSNVIHLGDHNVPNALTFIDKYTQVPRILGPIVSCLENLERICEEDNGVKDFVSSGFGGVEQLKKDILYDFFKSAFDGSGADNFYDAGSCIDGRLTSAWNWCSQLPSKPFFCIFKLTGFTGFDGEFK